MATIGITGGNGFVGRALAAKLRATGDNVIIFSRTAQPTAGTAGWNPSKQEINTAALAGLDAVIHLAGAGVADKRWTAARKAEISDSRISGTRFLVRVLREHAPRCKTLISASAIGYYGENQPGEPLFVETDPPADDFLARTCRDWEAIALEATAFCRVALLRTGIVLGKGSGALPKLTASFPFRIAPVLGSGRQLVSWIHLTDLVDLYIHALRDETVSGSLNAVAPHPVAHRQLMQALAKVKGGPFLYPPVPELALKIILGEMSTEVLKSCGVSAEKAQSNGYVFSFPEIEAAAQDLMHKQ